MVRPIHHEARRAAKITRDLLEFARGDEGAFAPVNVNELANEVASLRAVTQASAGISLSLDLDDRAGMIPANRAQLMQVIVNLVTNAEDAVSAAEAA